MEYCTDRWLGRQMEATEEKKDRQTEGQTTKLRQIQQDTKADQWSDERETQEKERTEGKADQERTDLIEAIMAVQRAILRWSVQRCVKWTISWSVYIRDILVHLDKRHSWHWSQGRAGCITQQDKRTICGVLKESRIVNLVHWVQPNDALTIWMKLDQMHNATRGVTSTRYKINSPLGISYGCASQACKTS